MALPTRLTTSRSPTALTTISKDLVDRTWYSFKQPLQPSFHVVKLDFESFLETAHQGRTGLISEFVEVLLPPTHSRKS